MDLPTTYARHIEILGSSMSSKASITVVVPTYNTQRFLDQALTSAQQNSSSNLEILVINDGSTDGSLSIMRQHARLDDRVRVIDKPNEGYGATVNLGIEEAHGDYVAILEPDDYVVAGAYDWLCEAAAHYGMPEVLKTSYWRVMSHNGADASVSHGYLSGRIASVGKRICLAEEPQLIQYHPSVWAGIYSREFLLRENIRMLEVPGAGWVDNPFCVETLVAAKSIVFLDEAFYCYREDLASGSSASASAQLMIDRWNDRQNVLDTRGVLDSGIRQANAVVATRFLGQMISNGALDNPTIRCNVAAMLRRIDRGTLESITCVSPSIVSTALELAGYCEYSAPRKTAYAVHLINEAEWALRANGPSFLLHNLSLAAKR